MELTYPFILLLQELAQRPYDKSQHFRQFSRMRVMLLTIIRLGQIYCSYMPQLCSDVYLLLYNN
jgi:hypothetical protein